MESTTKDKPGLTYDGFRFRVGSTSKNEIVRWRCCKKSCPAKVFTLHGEVVNSTGEHTHDESTDMNASKIRQACKRKAATDLTCKPSKIIKTEHASVGDVDLDAKDYKRIREAIYRERRKKFPVFPKNLEEVFVKLETLDIKTGAGENFILENDSENKMVMLSCNQNLEFMCTCDMLLSDGTFKCVPKFFTQMYVIVGLRQGWYVPLVFIFMNCKTEETYDLMWHKLKTHCQRIGSFLQPDELMMDFEKAAINSAQSAFPNSTVRGCRFHLAQAWNRKIQQLGLSICYKDRESEISKWLSYFYGLPFLRPEEVEDCFTENLFAIIPDDQRCTQFSDYILSNYIEVDCQFPPTLWASNDPELKRTNNGCESFNGHFNQEFYTSHPNIYTVMDVLVKFQVAATAKMNSARQGMEAPRQRKTIETETGIRELIQSRNDGNIDMFYMVKRLGYAMRD